LPYCPFDSISADPADAYLALGLPEMILTVCRASVASVIARIPRSRLPPRASIRARSAGASFGYLIGGSVQREADRLRVAVQLVMARGHPDLSAHFDRGLHDIFSMEDEIADQLAGALCCAWGA